MSDSGSPSRPWEWIVLINAAKQSERCLPASLFFLLNGERGRGRGREEPVQRKWGGITLFTRNKPTWREVENSGYRQTRYEGWKSEPYLGRMVKSVEKCRVCSRACLKGEPRMGRNLDK